MNIGIIKIQTMLKVEHITTGYGKKQVLSDVSFEARRGEVVLVSGGNGSGKSKEYLSSSFLTEATKIVIGIKINTLT